MKLSVDRIVENTAICLDENEVLYEISLADLPEGIREGSIIVPVGNGYELDLQSENEKREALLELQNSLFDE